MTEHIGGSENDGKLAERQVRDGNKAAFQALAFFALSVIPGLRLTDQGAVGRRVTFLDGERPISRPLVVRWR